MPLPLEELTRQILLEEDRGQRIYNAITDGWAAFEEHYPRRHRWVRKSSHRHMLWEEIIKKLLEMASEDNDISFIEHQDTVSFLIEGEVLFRLKHATPQLITANYPTTEAKQYDDHEVDLFGFAGVQRVQLCYVLNQFGTGIIWAGIVAKKNGRLLWRIELDGTGAIAPVYTLPIPVHETDTTKLARLKKSSTETEQKPKDGQK